MTLRYLMENEQGLSPILTSQSDSNSKQTVLLLFRNSIFLPSLAQCRKMALPSYPKHMGTI